MRKRLPAVSALQLACLAATALWANPLTAQEPAASKPAARAAAMPRARPSAPVTLNFVNADIEAVTRAMSALIDQPILVDPRVKGTITVYSEQPISVREAYHSYLAALRGLGFALVDNNGLLKVLPEAEAKLQAGTVSVGPVEQRGDQIITQVFRLNHENPNNLVAVLRPLISPNNTINANPGNNALVITDYADNLARIGRIIAALDMPAAAELEVVPLQHAVAADVAALMQKLGEGGTAVTVPGVPAASAGASVIVDPRSNALIIRAANPTRLASMRALIAQLDRPSSSGPAGSIQVVHLKNADATKLAAVLRAAFGSGAGAGAGSGGGVATSSMSASPAAALMPGAGTTAAGAGASPAATTPVAASAQPSTGGFIQADPATNSLIITAPEPLYRQMRQVIEQLDGRRAQVFVESMIVEMDAQKAADFGFQWQGLLGRSGDATGLALGTNFGSGSNNIINLSSVQPSGLQNLSVGASVNGLNLGLIQRINGVYTLAGLARFLETVSGTNILSTPNLVALDNEEAKIVVGANVPFVTGSFTNTGSSTSTVNPFQTIERKDVGLTLRVKPQIGEGGVVRMTIYQENSAVVASSASNTNGPSTTKSSIETTVVVDDGAIMVLGGQLKDQYDGADNKVPVLGDLPVVGNLFRSENRTRRKTNLLVFLRPVVLRDQHASSSLTMDRYEQIRAVQQSVQPVPSTVMPINESAVLPPLQPTTKPPAAAPAPASAPASAPEGSR